MPAFAPRGVPSVRCRRMGAGVTGGGAEGTVALPPRGVGGGGAGDGPKLDAV
jgi:hypothetical protein